MTPDTLNGSQLARALRAHLLTIVGAAAMTSACGTTAPKDDGGAQAGPSAVAAPRAQNTRQYSEGPAPVVCLPAASTGGKQPSCPEGKDQSIGIALSSSCGPQYMAEITRLTDKPDAKGQCCYQPVCHPVTGRPLLVNGVMAMARPETRSGWGVVGIDPSLQGLSDDERRALARAFTSDALMEHASIASFGRVALQLLAMGAPADLVEDTHRAALDEARHARICFALASAYAREPVGPGALLLEGSLELQTDSVDVARRLVREGCVGETLAAVVMSARAESVADPHVRALLEEIADDEARHAALAWRTLMWLIERGGSRVRGAALEELELAAKTQPNSDAELDPRANEAMRRALDEVVAPCARSLANGSGHSSMTPS